MAYRPSSVRNQKSQAAPSEPDMVPVMNLFLTIIPFLMLFVVLSNIALISLNLSAGGGEGGGDGGGGEGGSDIPKIQVIIYRNAVSDPSEEFAFEIREPKLPKRVIPALNGRYDYVALDAALKEIKARRPELGDINVVPHDEVLFETLLQTIDLCKKNNFPFVHYEVIDVIGVYASLDTVRGGKYAA